MTTDAANTSFTICAVVAEGMAGNDSSADNPAVPKTTPVSLKDDAMTARSAASGVLLVAAIVAGVVMM